MILCYSIYNWLHWSGYKAALSIENDFASTVPLFEVCFVAVSVWAFFFEQFSQISNTFACIVLYLLSGSNLKVQTTNWKSKYCLKTQCWMKIRFKRVSPRFGADATENLLTDRNGRTILSTAWCLIRRCADFVALTDPNDSATRIRFKIKRTASRDTEPISQHFRHVRSLLSNKYSVPLRCLWRMRKQLYVQCTIWYVNSGGSGIQFFFFY